jgi:hypothetical protein
MRSEGGEMSNARYHWRVIPSERRRYVGVFGRGHKRVD